MKRIGVFVIVLVLLVLVACGGGGTAEPEIAEVEVTRIVEKEVEVEVEVTRLVEVEVTRLVEVEKKVVVTATPKPTPKPTATPNAPKVGTRANPIPIGTARTLIKNGEIEFELTVVEVFRGTDALQRIKSANQFNDDPPDGFEFVLILASVAYTGEDKGLLEVNEFVASSVTNDRVISYSDTFIYSPCCLEPTFDMQLLQGGTGEGWIALPVAVDDPAPLMLIGEVSTGVFFSLTP